MRSHATAHKQTTYIIQNDKALPPITNVKLGPFLPKVTKGYSANPAKVLFDTEEDL